MRHYATSCKAWQVDVLLKSLRRHCEPFTLHVLAWDWKPALVSYAHDNICGGSGQRDFAVEFTTRAELCARHPHLRELPGPPRTPIEEACSVRWRWFADTVAKVWERDGGSLMCIDGDTWLFADPEPVWRECEAQPRPWALTEHRFPTSRPGATQESHGRFGRFNAGALWLREPGPALDVAALTEAWCRGTFLDFDGRPYFGDQGAVERIHEVVPAYVLRHPGVNLAPWNVHDVGLMYGDDKTPLWVKAPGWAVLHPLVLYHYSSVRVDARGAVLGLADPGYEITPDQVRVLYFPYEKAIGEVFKR